MHGRLNILHCECCVLVQERLSHRMVSAEGGWDLSVFSSSKTMHITPQVSVIPEGIQCHFEEVEFMQAILCPLIAVSGS